MKKILNILLIIIPFFCSAQKQGNIWYFGDHAGLDFNSGSPIPLTNGQTYSPDGYPIEGTAVISDSSGALLFYTNGMKIWNKNQQVMPNGDSLFGGYSSTQSALIIPNPGSNRYFYIFTTDAFWPDSLKYGFRYSKVDMCLDNGLGDVMNEKKNIKILDTVCEKLTAVRHANGVDYWVIVHKYYSDAFYSYHLSSAGIVDTVISHLGSRHPAAATYQDTWAAIGEMKASPDGSKLAIVNGNTGIYAIREYFNFDKSTGVVSNWVNLQTNTDYQNDYQYYGISFSQDNSKLYISCCLNNNGIFQFNLNAGGGNADSVRASMTKIAGLNWTWGLQLGTDGKIYVAGMDNQYLSVINNPNNLGLNCNFQDSAIYLNGKICSYGLPNFIDSYDYSNTIVNCDVDGITEKTNKTKTTLGDAQPNPNSGSTQISYFLPDNISNAKIIFTDMLGKVIEEQVLQSGYGLLNIDTQNLPSGIYSYTLIVDEKVIVTKKIMRNK